MIYFIVTEDFQFLKVGFSLDPPTRLKTLQTGNPLELKLLHTIPGTRRLEESLHREFSPFWVKGEWYKADPSILFRMYEDDLNTTPGSWN